MVVLDLHIHGRYSGGCSKAIDLQSLAKWSKVKGIDVLGTGDFTHPLWLKHLKENLTEKEGILYLENEKTKFLLQTEISFIYSQDGKTRRVHNLILAPNFDVVDQIVEAFGKWGRLDYDGRPIFGKTCPELVETLRSISHNIEVIPAHVFTPHFSVFGSLSGFDSLKEAFKDQTKHIHALETGLSADPGMMHRISSLDKYSFVSFSDAHSFWPWRIGREATIVDAKLSYQEILKAIKENKIKNTLEFWPHEGKYHFDGHRKCNISMHPKDSIAQKNLCPVCNKQMTLGVAHRVEVMADRPESYVPKDAPPYLNLVPLSEIISTVVGKGVATKTVWKIYDQLLETFGNEIDILLNVPKEELSRVVPPNLVKWIIKNREQKIVFEPGYDGVYGKMLLKE